jgi:hypothetical protein
VTDFHSQYEVPAFDTISQLLAFLYLGRELGFIKHAVSDVSRCSDAEIKVSDAAYTEAAYTLPHFRSKSNVLLEFYLSKKSL